MNKTIRDTNKVKAIVKALLPWFAKNARDLPWRREPYCRDPYCVYVSEIMLQQTQVKTVLPYWNRWMRQLPTIQSVARASPARLHKLWEGLGYYTRVRNLQKAAQHIVTLHGDKFPRDFDDILALPGVGRYTAGAICSIAFNQPKPVLDGNVMRVLTRLFGIAANPREKRTNARLWKLAEGLVGQALRCLPRRGAETAPCLKDSACSHLNQSLMELGALICTPRSPSCAGCPLRRLCLAFREDRQEQLPNLGRRIQTTARRFKAFAVESNGRFLVRERPAGGVNAHLWEFPNTEIQPGFADVRSAARRGLSLDMVKIKPLCTIRHSITRYRITLEAFRAELANVRAKPAGQWLTLRQLHRLAFTSAHKKILARLIG